MKKIRNNLFILFFVLFVSIVTLINSSSNAYAAPLTIPNHLKVTLSDYVINEIRYEDFILEARKINTDVGPAYCLEVEKDYPSGQIFEFEGKPSKEVVGMMAAGYPSKSADELGVDSNDDAYFVTQIAIWCVTEGYEPNKFRHEDKYLLQAIKNIYNEGMQYTGEDVGHTSMEYYYSEAVQRIVVYINNPIENNINRISDATDEGTGGINEGTDGRNEVGPDVPTWPEFADDEEDVVVPEEYNSDRVVVPGLG